MSYYETERQQPFISVLFRGQRDLFPPLLIFCKTTSPVLLQGTQPRVTDAPSEAGDANHCPAPHRWALDPSCPMHVPPMAPSFTDFQWATSLKASKSDKWSHEHLYCPNAQEFNKTQDILACTLPTSGEIHWYTKHFFYAKHPKTEL